MPSKFLGQIYTVWIIRCVDLPDAVRKKFPGKNIPIKGTCNGVPFRGTLMSKAGGKLRVALNSEVREAAGNVDAGDRVVITLERANAHPMPRMPKELADALAQRPGGRLAWEERGRSWRRHVLLWYLETKNPAVRAKRAGLIVKRLGLEGG